MHYNSSEGEFSSLNVMLTQILNTIILVISVMWMYFIPLGAKHAFPKTIKILDVLPLILNANLFVNNHSSYQFTKFKLIIY